MFDNIKYNVKFKNKISGDYNVKYVWKSMKIRFELDDDIWNNKNVKLRDTFLNDNSKYTTSTCSMLV